MNALLVALVIASAPLVLCYDEKYDKIDVDKILGDDNLFNAYMNCLLDKGPCEVEHSTEFKKLLPEVIATACDKCTTKQKDHVRKSVKAIQERKPEEFLEFRKKYDPKGEYEENFAAFMVATD